MTICGRLVALAALLIAACSQPTAHPVAGATISPSPSAQPSTSSNTSPAASPTPDAGPIPDLPVTILNFRCQLPFSKLDARRVDEFITFPSGVVTIDPSGDQGLYYDRAYSRWLPVPRFAVSPDGTRYVSIESAATEYVIHVVTVATGKEVLLHLSTQMFDGQPLVFDFSNDGIYLVQGFEHLLAGMWLVDPASGSVRQISKDLFPIYSAGNGIVWTQVVNPADPNPVVTGTSLGTLPNEIDRVDLRSGTRTEWFYEPGEGLNVVGLDRRGFPLIESSHWGYDPNARLSLVVAPDTTQLIFKGAIVPQIGGGVTDSHGVWMGGQRGIYLYSNAGFLMKVSNHPADLANGCF